MTLFRAILILGTVSALQACGSSAPTTNLGRRPDWSVTLPDGSKASASNYDNKVTIVDFWATWCPPCRKEVPGFIELKKKYGSKGLEIVGFSFDRDRVTHVQWVTQNQMNYLSVFCGEEERKGVVAAFEALIGPIQSIPTTLVIDRKGNIVYRHVGYGSPEEFEKVIKPLL